MVFRVVRAIQLETILKNINVTAGGSPMKFSSILLASVCAMSLAGCGKSEAVTKLEGVVAAAEADMKACESKKGTELTTCLTSASTKMAKDWGTAVVEATNDDPEAVQALTTKMTELTQKAAQLATNAF